MTPTLETLASKLATLEERVAQLEGAAEAAAAKTPASKESYAGPRGGLRFLIDADFFAQKRALGDVRGALAKDGYFYSRQAVHQALAALAAATGPLVSLKEGAKKIYVNRK